jgi:N-acetyl-D-muramate 6-phosphate phosphatase
VALDDAAAHAVLFDLDGTLLDTAPDFARSLNLLLSERGLEPLPFARIRSYCSHGSAALVRLAFPDESEAEFIVSRDRLLDIYREQLAVETRIFEGMDTVLSELDRRGLPWAIVTNKPGWLTAPLLDALGLATRAASVVSGDTFPERKPHPRPLLFAAEEMKVAPERCLYVGDAERDMLAARAANMRALAVRFGYIAPTDKPHEWPAHGWVDTPLEVLDWLNGPPATASS